MGRDLYAYIVSVNKNKVLLYGCGNIPYNCSGCTIDDISTDQSIIDILADYPDLPEWFSIFLFSMKELDRMIILIDKCFGPIFTDFTEKKQRTISKCA